MINEEIKNRMNKIKFYEEQKKTAMSMKKNGETKWPENRITVIDDIEYIIKRCNELINRENKHIEEAQELITPWWDKPKLKNNIMTNEALDEYEKIGPFEDETYRLCRLFLYYNDGCIFNIQKDDYLSTLRIHATPTELNVYEAKIKFLRGVKRKVSYKLYNQVEELSRQKRKKEQEELENSREYYIDKLKKLDPYGKHDYNKGDFNSLKKLTGKYEKFDNDFRQAMSRHSLYKALVNIGYFLGVTGQLWIPFFVGLIIERDIAAGVAYVFAAALISPITLPLLLAWTFLCNPSLLKGLLFEEPDTSEEYPMFHLPINWYKCYDENVANAIKYNSMSEVENARSALAGSIIGNFI